MIVLSRLNGLQFMVNAELVETVEATPDTVVTLTTGRKFLVEESVEEVVSRILEYRRAICRPLPGEV